MTATTGIDALMALFDLLGEEEQDRAARLVAERQLVRQVGSDREMARFIGSLQRVRDHVGHVPGVDEYKRASRELMDQGEELVTFARLYQHFGSWPQAQEMLGLADSSTPRRLEARMRYRQLGKVHRFTDDQLREALVACVEHYGRCPTVAEYDWWRDHQLQKAAAAGDDTRQLPSPGPFRRRYTTWDAALEHFGYEPDHVQERLSRRADAANQNAEPYLPPGLPVAELDPDQAEAATQALASAASEAANRRAAVVPAQMESPELRRLAEVWAELPARSRYVLTVRLGLGETPARTLKQAAAPIGLHLDRIRQLQLAATELLAEQAFAVQRSNEQQRVAVTRALTELTCRASRDFSEADTGGELRDRGVS